MQGLLRDNGLLDIGDQFINRGNILHMGPTTKRLFDLLAVIGNLSTRGPAKRNSCRGGVILRQYITTGRRILNAQVRRAVLNRETSSSPRPGRDRAGLAVIHT